MRAYLSDRMGAALLMAPLLLFLVLAYAWPFLGVVKWSFTLPTPGLGQYNALLTDDLVQSVFIRTLRIAAIGFNADLAGAERLEHRCIGFQMLAGAAGDEDTAAAKQHRQQQLVGQVFADRRAVCEISA